MACPLREALGNSVCVFASGIPTISAGVRTTRLATVHDHQKPLDEMVQNGLKISENLLFAAMAHDQVWHNDATGREPPRP